MLNKSLSIDLQCFVEEVRELKLSDARINEFRDYLVDNMTGMPMLVNCLELSAGNDISDEECLNRLNRIKKGIIQREKKEKCNGNL